MKQVLSINFLGRVLKMIGFVLIAVVGLALILVLIALGIVASPMIVVALGLQWYFDFRTERMKTSARLEYKLKKNSMFQLN